MFSGFIIDGKPVNPVGSNDANNVFDSSLVAANKDGSVLERLEYLQGLVEGNEPVVFRASPAPMVDEAGGRLGVAIAVVDLNSGPIAAGSIDITGATVTLEKSTGGGAFSTVGVTQPGAPSKAAGEVTLDFDILAAEWQVGDVYRLKIAGITASVNGTTYYAGTLTWVQAISQDLDVKTGVDNIYARLGAPAGASIAADLATIAGYVDTEVAAIKAKTDNLPAVPASQADAQAGATVPAADAVTNSNTRDVVGAKDDTANETVGTTSSLMRYLKGALGILKRPSAADNGVAAATASLYETLGRKDDTKASGVGSTQSAMAYLKAATSIPNADGTFNIFVGDVVGSKADAAATSIASTKSIVAYVKAILAALGIWTTDAYATVSCATGAETDVVAQVTITKPTLVIAKLDLTNLTQNATIKVYHAMGAAGATLTAENSRSWVVATDGKVVPIEFRTTGDYKITVTTGAEGASRNVYVRHARRVGQ